MEEFKRRVDELAALIEEFQLAEAKLEGDDWKVAFKARRVAPITGPDPNDSFAEPVSAVALVSPASEIESPMPAASLGEPVTSPMNGIYYARSSPSAPPFVREGDEVEEGQVLALIEAMKVFNEIVAPFGGTITRIVAKNGDLVQAGEPLMFMRGA